MSVNLFVIDDHKIIRDGIKLMLDSETNIHVVGEAESGKEALEQIEKRESQMDIILMDINIPDINGIELTKSILKIHPNLKIIALTMHNQDSYVMAMLEAGASGYVLKDGGATEIVSAIKAVAIGRTYYSQEVSAIMAKFLATGNKPKSDGLSERELEVLVLIANGKTNKEAGEELFVSERTIESHRRNIMVKLNCKNTVELVHYAYKKNLLTV